MIRFLGGSSIRTEKRKGAVALCRRFLVISFQVNSSHLVWCTFFRSFSKWPFGTGSQVQHDGKFGKVGLVSWPQSPHGSPESFFPLTGMPVIKNRMIAPERSAAGTGRPRPTGIKPTAMAIPPASRA